ncbi:MAG TPA: oxidoreductase [Rhizobiales bacterium]|nr:acrylyl-CoA reductase AcuI [bacterium BMS3Bbin10]HDO52563.1 oxidoreductase [Hyphomicrobiales bacterium]
MAGFKALLATKTDGGQSVDWVELTEDDLMDGDVTIKVTHSTLNYKDGLAITGKAPVIRRWPMIPGVDLAGVVESSSSPDYKPGDKVVVNGWQLGETHYGGYAEKARVKSGWLVPLPKQFNCSDAMAIGTAGYTAMLCVMALEEHDVKPGDGPVLVTGASGGVGGVAIALLSKLGYEVAVSTGRTEEEEYLKYLGASEVIDRSEFSGKPAMLGKERWAGAIDSVGSSTLANVLSQTKFGGCVAACGLAQGTDLPTTVMPFILRGITLQGVQSVMTPKARRVEAWERLAKNLDIGKLRAMAVAHPLEDVLELAPQIVEGKVRGRVVFNIG